MIEPCKIKELDGKTYRCYFELTFQVIGGKWKAIILYHLSIEPKLRFGNLRRGIPEVTERMLTKQLRELEADGLVHREVYREVPPRVEYSLTELGCSVIPLLLKMREWGIGFEASKGGQDAFTGKGYESREAPPIAACHLHKTK
jgi:DNA-binding HxlR family transcriptional regulator